MLAARFRRGVGVDGGGFAITSTEAAPVSEMRMALASRTHERGIRHPWLR